MHDLRVPIQAFIHHIQEGCYVAYRLDYVLCSYGYSYIYTLQKKGVGSHVCLHLEKQCSGVYRYRGFDFEVQTRSKIQSFILFITRCSILRLHPSFIRLYTSERALFHLFFS